MVGSQDASNLDYAVTEFVGEMDLSRIKDKEVGNILQEHYDSGLGGQSVWQKLQSTTIVGRIHVAEDQWLKIVALKKKPNLTKITITHPQGYRIINAYDGKTAWMLSELDPSESSPVAMEADQARSFIHDSIFGSHLLFPSLPGKSIEYLGVDLLDDVKCYTLKVTLRDGYSRTYFIDAYRFRIVGMRYIDAASGIEQMVRYLDFRLVAGVPTAFRIEFLEGGELQRILECESISPNRAQPDWIYLMPPPK